jgi:hypothetical protein
MKNAVEMASDGIIYTPSSVKIGSGVQELLGGMHRQTRTHTDTKVIS